MKIIDFGLADTDWHGILKQLAGSNKYAVPEQVAGGVPLDCRADLYAFGVIFRQIFPHYYGGIARKCTQPDREKRYRNAEEVLRKLQNQQAMIVILPITIIIMALLGGILVFNQHRSASTRNHSAAESDVLDISPSDSFGTHSKDTIVVQKIENAAQDQAIPQGVLQMIETAHGYYL